MSNITINNLNDLWNVIISGSPHQVDNIDWVEGDEKYDGKMRKSSILIPSDFYTLRFDKWCTPVDKEYILTFTSNDVEKNTFVIGKSSIESKIKIEKSNKGTQIKASVANLDAFYYDTEYVSIVFDNEQTTIKIPNLLCEEQLCILKNFIWVCDQRNIGGNNE